MPCAPASADALPSSSPCGPEVAPPGTDPVEAARAFLTSLTSPSAILVAISGGSDSKALLLALHSALQDSTVPRHRLLAATVDHGLRSEAATEALEVARFCDSLSISHEILHWDGDKPATGLMAAARDARYRLLAEAALRHGASAIVTGHTATDQTETRSMRAERTGTHADAGMADAVLHTPTGIWILRPFLSVTRDNLRTFLDDRNESWIDDPSNVDLRFERARLRISGTAARLAGSDDPVDLAMTRHMETEAAALLLATHLAMPVSRIAQLAPAFLADLTQPGARRALFALARVIGGRIHGPGKHAEARILAFLLSGVPGRRTAGRVVFDRRRDGLWLYRETRGLTTIEMQPGETGVWDERLRIDNGSDAPVRIGPTSQPATAEDALVAAGVPKPIARRAAPAEPEMTPAAGVDPRMILAPWDTFLPRFDLTIASIIADRAGLAPYPRPPGATN